MEESYVMEKWHISEDCSLKCVRYVAPILYTYNREDTYWLLLDDAAVLAVQIGMNVAVHGINI